MHYPLLLKLNVFFLYSLLHSPLELFRQAECEHKAAELELLCISLAMQRFLERQLNGKLFLNISPSVLLSLGTRPLLETAQNAGMSPLLIVIELTENHPAASGDDIIRIVKSLKSLGFMVAIDDLGAGNSGLRLWSELRPDFVKLDAEEDSRSKMTKKIERRTYSVRDVEARADGDGMRLAGYAAVFNDSSVPLPFKESIAPGALYIVRKWIYRIKLFD